MNSNHFLARLKAHFPSQAWREVLVALRQDQSLWEALATTPLGETALAALPGRREQWLPASLACLSIDPSLHLEALKAGSLASSSPDLEEKALAAYKDWKDLIATGSLPIAEAGLVALAIREQEPPGAYIALWAEKSRPTRLVIACLLGFAGEMSDVLADLLATIPASDPAAHRYVEDAIHGFLCNPLSEEEQFKTLAEALRSAPETSRLAAMEYLAGQRPAIASRLSLEADIPHFQALAMDYGQRDEFLGYIAQLTRASAVQEWGDRPAQAIPFLAEALKTTRRLHALIAGKLGQAAATINDHKTALEAWKQAAQFSPESDIHAAGLALSLVEAGRPEDARAFLAARQSEAGLPAHPAVLIAHARMHEMLNENEKASQAAGQALNTLENGSFETFPVPFHRVLAGLLFRLGSVEQMARSARLVLLQRPNDVEMLERLARAALAQGRIEAALPAAQLACALSDGNYTLQAFEVECLEAGGEWESALVERRTMMERGEFSSLQPEEQVAEMDSLAACAIAASEYPQAIQACQAALQIIGDHSPTLTFLGKAYLELGDQEKAFAAFQQATLANPELPDAWLAMAQALQITGEPERALSTLQEACMAASQSAAVHLAMGEAYREREEFTKALACFRLAAERENQAAEAQPVHPLSETYADRKARIALATSIATSLGEALRRLGHTEEACQILQTAYVRYPQAPAIARAYAGVLVEMGKLQDAIPPMQAYIASHPADPAAFLEYARLLVRVAGDDPSMAIQAAPFLEQVLQTLPESSLMHQEARVWLAEVLAMNGEYIQACELFQQALEDPLGEAPAWQIRISLGLGEAAMQLGRFPTAVSAFNQAVREDPDNPENYRRLAQACQANGQLPQALQAGRTALRLAPSDPAIVTWFARQVDGYPEQADGTHMQAQSEAIAALLRATQLFPERNDLLACLGRIELKSGNSTAALEILKKFAGRITAPDADPGSAGLEDIFQAARGLHSLGDHANALALMRFIEGSTQPASRPEDRFQADRFGAALDLVDVYLLMHEACLAIGDHTQALAALNQAIQRQPGKLDLILKKADVLNSLGSNDEARACLQGALAMPIADRRQRSALQLRMAQLLRAAGQLPDALSHAKSAAMLESHLAGPAHCLAANLWRAVLAPEKAREFLPDLAQVPDELDNRIEFTCLAAELALENNEDEQAAQALALVEEYLECQPRILAGMSRLLARQGEPSFAQERFEAAKALIAAANQVDVETLRSYAAAAQTLGAWQIAMATLDQVIEIAPSEARSLVEKAQALVEQAEAEVLCQALGVTRHNPGAQALAESTARAFLDCVQRAESLAGNPAVARWFARGQAIFHPDEYSARLLEEGSNSPEEVAALVVALARSGQAENAIRAAGRYPENPHVQLCLAAMLSASHSAEAMAAARQMVVHGAEMGNRPLYEAPLPAALLAKLGLLHGECEDDLLLALQASLVALKLWPDEPNWHKTAADIYLKVFQKDHSRAISHMEQACALDPGAASFILALGNIYLNEKKLDQAIPILEQACLAGAEQGEVWISLGKAQRAAGRLDLAGESFEKAIERSEDPVEALLLRGEIALETDNPRAAQNRAQAVLRLNPSNAHGLNLMARAYAALNKPAEALGTLEQAIPLADEPLPLLLERARLLREVKGAKTALQAFQELSTSYPEEAQVHRQLAECLMETEQPVEAVIAARKALRHAGEALDASEIANLHLLVGRELSKAGQLDQAVQHLSEAVEHDPQRLETLLELGHAFRERRQYVQASEVYRQAQRIFPQDYRPYYFCGSALKESKDYRTAEEMLRKAAELAPQEVSVQRMLGAIIALNLVHNRRDASVYTT